MTRDLHRAWRRLGARGIAALLFACAALFVPTFTLTGLFLVFGAYVLVDGMLAFAAAWKVHPGPLRWHLVSEGALGTVVGVATLLLTPLEPKLIGGWLAVWAVATGIVELWLAFRMRRFVFAGPYWLLGGAISLLVGVLLAIWPVEVASSLVLLLGFYALVFGLAMLGLAWSLRRVERNLETWTSDGVGANPVQA
jgi:uncharacterized membrane protein HdeD (DUF308 family)